MREVYVNRVQFPPLGAKLVLPRRVGSMRLTEFDQLVEDEFGKERAQWIVHSQVLPHSGRNAAEMIECGVDPREVWLGLCDAFDIPEERRLGIDRPGR